MPNTVKSIRVLLTDSRPVVLKGLEGLINGRRPRMEAVGSAATYAKALDLADQVHPDVVLFSFFPDALDALEVIARLTGQGQVKLLVLKGLYEAVPVARALEMGARGVVLAEDPTESITRAIAKVHDSNMGRDRAWTGGLSNYAGHSHSPRNGDPEEAKLARLTSRERELIRAIAANPSAKYMTIAGQLGISEHTVHNHLTSIYHKLDLINRIDLLVYALKYGLLESDEAPESGWVNFH
jgi:two-component system, NarL family, response regulator LiaR